MASRAKRRPTVKEVARRAKVSVGTVSNVLAGVVPVSEDLRIRVENAIKDLDYHPDQVARSLKSRLTKVLAAVISDITNPFFPLLVRGAEDAAWKHKNLLITFNTDDREQREIDVLKALRGRQVDGVLLVAASTRGQHAHIRALIETGIQVVLVDRELESVQADTLVVDNCGGSRTLVRHLIEAGHRRIGLLGGARDLVISKQRRAGYRQALNEAGIRPESSLERFGAFRADSGYEQGCRLLDLPSRPSAVFASNGVLALGFLQALEERRLRCPEDISLVCFDELPVAAGTPRLTCIAQPAYELGRCGMEMLLERIAHPDRPLVHRELPIKLLVNHSVAPPHQARS